MKILTVVGTRPQFIKAAAVSQVLRRRFREILVHTGQHYDPGMSEVFFEELGIPEPEIHLGIGSGTHGAQTGAMLSALEAVILRETPDWVLVYGDTNSTLAGALAAAKLHVPVAHVEAGVRSGNWQMAEEINRVLTDAAADLLLAPTRTALDHLAREGVHGRVVWVGDVMLDLARAVSNCGSDILERLGLRDRPYLFATVHRAENTDNPARLQDILEGLARLELPVVFPVHPRTRKMIAQFGLERYRTDLWIDPLGYVDTAALVRGARAVLTDSGGLQKEAVFHGVPCVTLRGETEWPETIEAGWNRLAGSDPAAIAQAVAWACEPASARPSLGDLLERFGAGKASERVAAALAEHGAEVRPC